MSEIQSLARGLKILDLMAQSDDEVRITDIATELDIDKSSATRLLQTLANYGYAEQDADTHRYRLGPKVILLGQSLLKRVPLRDQARAYLEELVAQTGECAHLAVHSQGQALYIDQVESSAVLRVNTGVGTMAPLHCTALGKIMLAFGRLPLPTLLDAFTTHTLTDPAALQAHLAQTRRQGYAIDDEEYHHGVRCVAAPVFNADGRLVGAIGISGPSRRIDSEQLPELGQIVVKTASLLSDRLGHKA